LISFCSSAGFVCYWGTSFLGASSAATGEFGAVFEESTVVSFQSAAKHTKRWGCFGLSSKSWSTFAVGWSGNASEAADFRELALPRTLSEGFSFDAAEDERAYWSCWSSLQTRSGCQRRHWS